MIRINRNSWHYRLVSVNCEPTNLWNYIGCVLVGLCWLVISSLQKIVLIGLLSFLVGDAIQNWYVIFFGGTMVLPGIGMPVSAIVIYIVCCYLLKFIWWVICKDPHIKGNRHNLYEKIVDRLFIEIEVKNESRD